MSYGPYPWAAPYGPTTSDPISQQTESTYLAYNKIKGFEDVGYFLVPYVVSGGYVTKNIKRNDAIDISKTVVVLDDDVDVRQTITGIRLKNANSTYFVDFYKGDYWVDTAHPPGTVGTNYLTLATVTTDAFGNVSTITDMAKPRGGFRLKSEYGLFGYLRQIYNIKDYGAAGDGIVDDTDAIILTIASATEGSVVWIPDGNYKVTRMIEVNKKIKLTGTGKLVSYIPAGGINYFYQDINYVFKITADHVTIDGLSFDNPTSAISTGGVFCLSNYLTVSNCRINNFTQPLCGGLNKTGLRVINNYITNVIGVASEAIGDGVLSFSTRSVIDGNFITVKPSTDGRTGATVDLGGFESVITNNTISGFRRNVHVELSPRSIVDSNICLGTSRWGIYVNNDTTIISNNIIQSTFLSPEPASGQIGVAIGTFESNFVNIIGNSIFAGGTNTGRGISVNGGYTNVSGNTIEGGKNAFDTFIFIESPNVHISENIMKNECVSGRGVDVINASNVSVSNNYLEKCGVHGISIRNSLNCKVNGNTSINNEFYGIAIEGNSTSCTISNNRCYDNQITKTQDYGVFIKDSIKVMVTGNNLDGNIAALSIDAASSPTALLADNYGVNPIGQITAPSFPASNVMVTNTFPFEVRVYIIGGTYTDVKLNTESIGVTTQVVLGRGDSISIMYSVAPTWKWFGL
ncbi:right-handed parallel beta-helix repeat-containing protein [Paenibacillus oleatilyticus]|uniref:Right-handed parallel beta-helix repeat-containing protein n=2 Tax=Paenibacillus oleatilyticus TaxID=2594886 RepID=A0ABV4VCI5_9BACL